MPVDSLAWHRLLGALTLCVYGQTFDLWCSILARSRGTVLLIFGIDPASGPASQIQKVRARAERRIAFALRQACFARTGSRCAGAFSWPLRLLERGPFGQLVSCRGRCLQPLSWHEFSAPAVLPETTRWSTYSSTIRPSTCTSTVRRTVSRLCPCTQRRGQPERTLRPVLQVLLSLG